MMKYNKDKDTLPQEMVMVTVKGEMSMSGCVMVGVKVRVGIFQ